MDNHHLLYLILSRRLQKMAELKITRIADLVDFGQHTIRGRVLSRKPLATTRAGKPWFSFMLDDDSLDVKVDCFDDAEKFSAQISAGDIIQLEHIKISSKTPADRRFDVSRSDYKVSIKSGTVVTLLSAANAAPPPDKDKQIGSALHTVSTISDAKEVVKGLSTQVHNSVGFKSELQSESEQMHTHICTILAGISDATLVYSSPESARQWFRLDLQVVDKTGSIKVSLWTEQLEPFLSAYNMTKDDAPARLTGKIVVLSRVQFRCSERYGIQCSCVGISKVFLVDSTPSKQEDPSNLKEFRLWWASQEAKEACANLSGANVEPSSPRRDDRNAGSWKTMPYNTLGELAGSDPLRVLASLILDRNLETATYRGCASCKSALRDSPICPKCQETSAGEKYYWRIGGHISDALAHTRITIFDPHASTLMGMSADEFVEKSDEEKLRLLSKVLEVDVAVKVQQGKYDGRDRTNLIGIELAPSYVTIFDNLVGQLQAYRRSMEAFK